jgi:hypothetical protein
VGVNKVTKSNPLEVSREQVLAFRLYRHNLSARLPSESLTEVAAGCGVRNSPPGSAELAFQARVTDFSPGQLENALNEAKTLLEVWCMRSSPFFFPTSDTPIFTLGLLPAGEEALRFSLKGILRFIDRPGKTIVEALDTVATAVSEALDGRRLTKGQLSTEVSQRVPKELLYWCQPCQAHHVPESLFRLAVQKAQVVFVPRFTSDALLFVRIDQWLGAPLPATDLAQAQTEALRRYLRCYGPSTPADFAGWAGISPSQAGQIWTRLVEDELVEVKFGAAKDWLLRPDLDLLEAPPAPQGVRLLPPYDAYLLLSDRTTIVPDKALHSHFWRAIGNPGAVLVDGEIAGSWRPEKKGKRLALNLTLFRTISAKSRAELETEAEMLAPLKGATTVEVKYEE